MTAQGTIKRRSGITGAVRMLAIAVLFMGGVAGAAVTSIDGSKHDLADGAGTQDITGGGANPLPAGTGVCVFCHTPHGSSTSASAPLWNKYLDTSKSYTRYSSLGTASLDGTEMAVGSVSLACLSCHDGTQAMDAVLNVPGSGMAAGKTANADGSYNLGAGTTMTGTPVPMLGPDLSNDHPISIQYAGGGCSSTSTGCATLKDKDFKTPQYATVNNKDVWWVDVPNTAQAGGAAITVVAGSRDKNDLLLYTRDRDGSGVTNSPEPFVECGSCHDPHNAGTSPVSFLRVDNTNSAVCLSCHVK